MQVTEDPYPRAAFNGQPLTVRGCSFYFPLRSVESERPMHYNSISLFANERGCKSVFSSTMAKIYLSMQAENFAKKRKIFSSLIGRLWRGILTQERDSRFEIQTKQYSTKISYELWFIEYRQHDLRSSFYCNCRKIQTYTTLMAVIVCIAACQSCTHRISHTNYEPRTEIFRALLSSLYTFRIVFKHLLFFWQTGVTNIDKIREENLALSNFSRLSLQDETKNERIDNDLFHFH